LTYSNIQLVNIDAITLVGYTKSITLSAANIADVFKTFMPLKNNIAEQVQPNVFSLSWYTTSLANFTPLTPFTKGAAVQVHTPINIPEGLQVISIPAGAYISFTYTGNKAAFFNTLQSIIATEFGEFNAVLTDEISRPYFEILNENYNRLADNNTEEVYLPVKIIL
jgi:AraC family transcriptional regulator